MAGIIHYDLVLHRISCAIVDQDIAVFLRDRFCEIREEFDHLPANWPGDDKIEHLIQRAYGLFIYTATVCRFIKGDGQCLPQDLLDIVLRGARSSHSLEWEHDVPSQSSTWELDGMYTEILQRSIGRIHGARDRDQV